MRDWRIYYHDGSAFSSWDGSPLEAPSLGVICIVQKDPVADRVVLHRWDWYHLVSGEWWGIDQAGINARCMLGEGVIALKQGHTIDTPAYREIFERARSDPQFPWGGSKTPQLREKPGTGG